MRRGGRFLYAFDVTDPTAPTFIWKQSSAQVPSLGQTWSEARVVRLKGHANPAIIMGGGYDPAEDQAPRGDITMGDSIIVLDAFTGDVLKVFTEPDRPVAADISVVDSDYDGFIDRAYAVDLGGTIYRIDLEQQTADGLASGVADWEATELANLGSAESRKFFFAPDVVLTKSYAIVLLGSGDREKPLAEGTQDYFFAVIDSNLGKGIAGDIEPIEMTDLVSPDAYASTVEASEKVVNAPLTIGGVTYFGTNRPTPADPQSCSANLGEARSYQFPLICKTPTFTTLEGGGLPPSPVGGVVEITYIDPLTGEEVTRHVPFIIGGDNEKHSPIEASRVRIAVPPRRTKIYWHTETER